MKTQKLFTTGLLLLLSISAMAQQGINYKALVKDGSGNLVANQSITVQFQILQGVGMTNVYQETHTPTTDANGFVILNIGEGTTSDVFTDVDWGSGDHYLNVQINTGGGLVDLGTTQFMAVPYALSVSSETIKINDLVDGRSDADGSSLFLGIDAGLNDDGTGNDNVAIGFEALSSNTEGVNNTATGNSTLSKNTTGWNNTANGYAALYSNTTGVANTATGTTSLYNNTDGSYNTATGYNALYSNTTGSGNTATGDTALSFNTTGVQNTANGSLALRSNTTGIGNTATGYLALYFNTEGVENTAVGSGSLVLNTASGNTAVGYQSLYKNTTGDRSSAFGYQALFNNTTGHRNAASGQWALFSNTVGHRNTGLGLTALYSNVGGYKNVATGYQALYYNTEGVENTATGTDALLYNFNGDANTANGFQALYNNILGNNNTATGHQALSSGLTGSNNIGIGYNAQSSSTSASNEVTIGNSDNNVYRMYAASWMNASDRKLKHDIKNIPVGLDLVLKLRPVEFVYNNANTEQKTFGFIAQDVKEAVMQSNLEDDILVSPLNKEYLGLRTTELISVLTKAIQEQQAIIDDQKKENKNLEARLTKVEQLLSSMSN